MTATEGQKQGREALVATVREVASEFGMNVVRDPYGCDTGREVTVEVEGPEGVYLPLDFDGDSPSSCRDVYVSAWNVRPGYETRFADFPGDRTNPHHRRKVSFEAHGEHHLRSLLRYDLRRLTSGEGLMLPPKHP